MNSQVFWKGGQLLIESKLVKADRQIGDDFLTKVAKQLLASFALVNTEIPIDDSGNTTDAQILGVRASAAINRMADHSSKMNRDGSIGWGSLWVLF